MINVKRQDWQYSFLILILCRVLICEKTRTVFIHNNTDTLLTSDKRPFWDYST